MPTTPDSSLVVEVTPSPTGPMTLHQEIQIGDIAIQAGEAASHRRSFIPPGSIEITKREQRDLHTRMALLLEAHPELAGMYEQHQQLLNEYYTNEEAGIDVTETQRNCRELADQIIALEQGVDLGSGD